MVRINNRERRELWEIDEHGQEGGSAPQDATMSDDEAYGDDDGQVVEVVQGDEHDEADEEEELVGGDEQQQVTPSAPQDDSEMADVGLGDGEGQKDGDSEEEEEDDDDEGEQSPAATQSTIAAPSTSIPQHPIHIHLPPLPKDLKIPEPTVLKKGRGGHNHWDNLQKFAHLNDVELLSGVVHPDDLCGTVMLDRLVLRFTHTQIKERIHELYAHLDPEKTPLLSSTITKRYTQLLEKRYPVKAEREVKLKQIQAVRTAVRNATDRRTPPFPASAVVRAATFDATTAAPATPIESSAASEEETTRKPGEDQNAMQTVSDGDERPAFKKVKLNEQDTSPSPAKAVRPVNKKRARAPKTPDNTTHDLLGTVRARITALEADVLLEQKVIEQEQEALEERKEALEEKRGVLEKRKEALKALKESLGQ